MGFFSTFGVRLPVALAVLLATPVAASPGEPPRALWVTRFDYRTAEDVVAAVRNTADAGFNTILFQVRGNATAFYDSPFEPWADELGGEDPGFDPLALACKEAHARGLQLHAWVNVMPAWWGTEPPTDPDHVYHSRPEWLWYDQNGRQQALCERFYVSLNPCLPSVRAYLTDILVDLATRYPIDGLHLDYIRFPNEPPATPSGSGLDYPRDPATLHLFGAQTGTTPDTDPAAWDAWRAARLTELVRDVATRLRALPDPVVLSAAVTPVMQKGGDYHQDIETWIEEGLLDVVFPMNYASETELFAARMEPWLALDAPVGIVMGVRAGIAGSVEERIQLALERADGFALFAYSTLFDSTNVQIDEQDAEARRERRARRDRVVPFLRSLRASGPKD